MKKAPYTIHIITCPKCNCAFKSFCEIKQGCYSRHRIECPQCGEFAGWISSCPGYKVERLLCIINRAPLVGKGAHA